MLNPLPIKEYAFSAVKTPMVEADLFIRGTRPKARNPSARMTRLRLVDNVRSWFKVFIDRKGWHCRLADTVPALRFGVQKMRAMASESRKHGIRAQFCVGMSD
jgi:hypothetical protein